MPDFYAPLKGCSRSLLWVCLLFSAIRAGGQCYPPSELPTQYCFPAPLVCLQNVCYSPVPWGPDFFAEPEDWCMTTNPSNIPQYYQFVATAQFVEIFITVTSCHGQDLCGLQAVIINQCAVGFNPWTAANIVACDAQACINQQLILAPGNMVPGNTYWLMIDNDGDATCEYSIDHLEGVLLPDITEELASAGTPDPVVCPGQDVWYAVAEPELTTVQGYLWTGFPWAPGYHVSRYHDMGGGEIVSIPENAPPGIYQICVQGFTGCDTTDIPVCFDLEIRDLDGISEPVTLCPEDYNNGVEWEGLDINGPGIYTQSYMSSEGCPYDSTKEFMIYPETFEGYIDTVLCGEALIYEGEEFFNPGTYSLYYEDANAYGCDSFAILSLDLSYIEAVVDFHCLNGQFVLGSEIIIAVPNQLGVQYQWIRNGTTLVSTDPGFTTSQPGTYELFINYFQCQFPAVNNPIIIDLDELLPPLPQPQFDSAVCANETATYTVVPDLDPVMRFYEWTIDPPVPFTLFDTLNSGIMVDWQGSTGGTVCVNAVNHCGVGQDTCFEITVIPAATAGFTLDAEACEDSTVVIEFTGTASPNATFIWNFGGGTIQSGGSGAGPHEIAWSSPGVHTVSLQVAEGNCDTSMITHDIFIENLGQPVLSCNSTVNSVTFEWSPVAGAVDYQVTVLQGPPGMIVGDSYVVTGLAPGTVVEIQLTVTGTGACPPQTATAQCIAQDCPPRTIQIQIADDTFCLGDVSGTIPLSATVDGSPANGTWSGPGVSPGGTFDPNHPSAGPGVHTIVFMYSDGTCMYQRSRNITVFDTPTATFNLNAAICQSSGATVQYTGNASVNATYTWDFGPGNASGSGAGPYTINWSTPGMYNVSLIVEEDGCESQEITHTIDVQPAIAAPTINCFPTTSSVTIQWGMVPNATSYDVTHLFGPMGTVNGNQYIVTGLMPGDSVSIEIEVSGNTLCPPVVVQASCVAQECPMPVIVVDPVDDVCLYPGTGTIDLNVTVTNGNGSGVWSGNGITNVQTGIFDPNLAGAGSHVIEYIYTDSGCSFLESINIDVFDPPVADISNTMFTLTCENNNELVLDGTNSTGSGNLTFQWTTQDGVILGLTNQPTATAGAAGDYTLTVIDAISLCEDMTTVTLVEDTGIPDADAGADTELNCEITSVEVGGNSSSGPTITYAWSSPDGGVIDSDPSAPTVTVSAGGTYQITVTDTENGCTAVDQVVVGEDYAEPSGILSVASIIDCDNSTTTISALANPPGSYTYTWSTVDGQIISGNGTSSILVGRSGTYTLTLTSLANGCSDLVSVQVFADPEVIAGLDVVLNPPECPGDADGSIHLIEVINGMPPYTYMWSTQDSGTILQLLTPGDYSITVTDARGCTFTETYTFPDPIAMNPDIGIDLVHEPGDSVHIIVTVQDIHAIADVIWDGVVPPCPGCFEVTFPAVHSGEVQVTTIDTNGCIATDFLYLTVDINKNVYIPNIFSPNGDFVNDVFRIEGKLLRNIEYLKIYDRWGNLVYILEDTPPGGDEGWDGTIGGKLLQPAVFVYTALLEHADDTRELVTGTVTLIR